MIPQNLYVNRDLESIVLSHLNKGKIIIIYGARQVGKTTLIKKIFFEERDSLYLSCEETRVKEQLLPDSLALRKIFGDYKNIIIDEAQYLENPGLVLKVMIDNFSQKNIIASGSSSFDLANKLTEPLTGRHFRFTLFPLSISEIKKYFSTVDIKFHINQSLIFGLYPEILKIERDEEKIEYLNLLTDAYLYKDILSFNLVKNNRKVKELLILLALQIGNEVSYNELANTLSIDRKTVEHYLDLLEKSFVLFRLYSFSRNKRSEINKKIKIYFYDLGVRNTLINNFNSLTIRTDAGAIFENYIVSEMIKQETNKAKKTNFYFWRTYNQKELDLITEKGEDITAYEIKLTPKKKISAFHYFKEIYPKSKLQQINMDNFIEII